MFHDRHARLLSNIYNLYTFGDLEKPIICDKPKKPDILTYFRRFCVAEVLQLDHVAL